MLALQEDPEVFHSAMCETGEALVGAAEWVLAPSNSPELGFGGDLEEYAQYLCASMGIWGCFHSNTLPVERRNVFLHLVSLLHQDIPPKSLSTIRIQTLLPTSRIQLPKEDIH